MSKISIEEVESILQRNNVDPAVVKTVITDLQEVVDELSASRTPTTKTKWEHVILIYDKDGTLKDDTLTGWVVQQKADADAGLIVGKLQSAAADQNAQVKRKKSLIKDVVGLFESLKTKFVKPKELKIKTKEQTRVILVSDTRMGMDKFVE